MFKNREILAGISAIFFFTVLSVLYVTAFPSDSIWVIVADGVIYSIGFYCFYDYRYRRLRELSAFLRKAQSSMLPLEISDQTEGELSVLKSEIYKLLTKLHTQTELLERDRQYLANTISDISHQLKTPMTSMNVMIDLLKDESLPAEKRIEFTRSLRRQMSRMEWLLSSMLTMSKLDAGSIVLKKETVNVSALITRASEHLLIPMELHGQTLVIEGEKEASFLGDLYWSSEALANILKNCMEHTPDGGTVTVRAGENSLYTSIQIQDEGDGIVPEDLPHIFERFYKGQNASPESIGIGLAMAKQFITRQNGVIEVVSEYGHSTTFLIKFYHYNI